MKEQVLSIGQMRHLQELGINIEVDSKYLNWGKLINVFKLALGVTGIPVCRAFTLQDMLEMMPCALFCDQTGNDISLKPINYRYRMSFYLVKELTGYEVKYEDYITKTILIYRVGKTAIEAAYNMLCWLAENELLWKEENR